jgi:hypothetical protein
MSRRWTFTSSPPGRRKWRNDYRAKSGDLVRHPGDPVFGCERLVAQLADGQSHCRSARTLRHALLSA